MCCLFVAFTITITVAQLRIDLNSIDFLVQITNDENKKNFIKKKNLNS